MDCKFLFLLFIISGFLFSGAMAQDEKNEVEDSINRDEMPGKALETLNEFWPVQHDIQYYFQTDGDTET